jgi:hypothetical protein
MTAVGMRIVANELSQIDVVPRDPASDPFDKAIKTFNEDAVKSSTVVVEQNASKGRSIMLITTYQYTSGVAAVAGTAALIAGAVLKDPYSVSVGICLIIVGGGGFFLAKKYKELRSHDQIFTQMLTENSRLKGQVEFFENQNQALQESNGALKGQVGELSDKVEKLQSTISRFNKENEELKRSNQVLSEQITTIEKQTDEIEDHLKIFSKENAELKKVNFDLKEEVEALESMSGKFQISLGEMVKNERAFNILKQQYELLQKQFSEAQKREIEHDQERQKLDDERIKVLHELADRENSLVLQEAEVLKELKEFSKDRQDLANLKELIVKLKIKYPLIEELQQITLQ